MVETTAVESAASIAAIVALGLLAHGADNIFVSGYVYDNQMHMPIPSATIAAIDAADSTYTMVSPRL